MVGVDSGLLGPAPEAHCLGVLTEGGQSWADDEQRKKALAGVGVCTLSVPHGRPQAWWEWGGPAGRGQGPGLASWSRCSAEGRRNGSYL